MYYPFLAVARLALHFNHDWGHWFEGCDGAKLLASFDNIDGVRPESRALIEDKLRSAWWIRRSTESDISRIGIAPASAHVTGTGRYSWEIDEYGGLSLRVYRPNASGGSILVAAVSLEFDHDHRGVIVDDCGRGIFFHNECELRHVGYLLELLAVVQGPEALPFLFPLLSEEYRLQVLEEIAF